MRTIPFGKPIIGGEEKKAVMDVLNGPILVHGPKAVEFEKDFGLFTGAPYATTVSSCTAAMHLYYFYLGLKAGDEVIVPAQTHTATAHVVELCGAKPVFVDSESDTGNIDTDQIEAGITENTRAISVVHFLGMPVNMKRVKEIARKYKLPILEDCALAIGTYFKDVHAGLHGDVGCFSFYPVKHMTTAEGGILITRNEDIARKIQRQKAFGVDRNMTERSVPGIYDVTMMGFNYRMNEIQAALGIEQLKRVSSFLAKRKNNYETLRAGLQDIEEISLLKSTQPDYQSSYYCLSVLLNEKLAQQRYEIVEIVKQNGVGTSVYYPKPVPHLSYYKSRYGYSDESYPVAAGISRRSIALPVGPHLDIADMHYVVSMFKKAITEVKKK
jgi:perosamine synthetase